MNSHNEIEIIDGAINHLYGVIGWLRHARVLNGSAVPEVGDTISRSERTLIRLKGLGRESPLDLEAFRDILDEQIENQPRIQYGPQTQLEVDIIAVIDELRKLKSKTLSAGSGPTN